MLFWLHTESNIPLVDTILFVCRQSLQLNSARRKRQRNHQRMRWVMCILHTVYCLHYHIYVKLVSKEPKSHNSGFCIVSHSRIANCEQRLSWMLIPQVGGWHCWLHISILLDTGVWQFWCAWLRVWQPAGTRLCHCEFCPEFVVWSKHAKKTLDFTTLCASSYLGSDCKDLFLVYVDRQIIPCLILLWLW